MRYIMLYPYVALVEGKDTGALYDLLNRKVIELEPEEFNILKQAKRGTSIDELYGYNLSDIHQVLNKIKQFKLGFDYESNKPYFCDLLKTSDEAMKLSHFKKGMVKVELALARGKKLYDKRRDIAKRDAQREIDRALSNRRRE